jgi:hypothetical protein
MLMNFLKGNHLGVIATLAWPWGNKELAFPLNKGVPQGVQKGLSIVACLRAHTCAWRKVPGPEGPGSLAQVQVQRLQDRKVLLRGGAAIRQRQQAP